MQYSRILHAVMPNVNMVMDLQTIILTAKRFYQSHPLSPTLLFDLTTLVSWAFFRTNK